MIIPLPSAAFVTPGAPWIPTGSYGQFSGGRANVMPAMLVYDAHRVEVRQHNVNFFCLGGERIICL